MKTKYLIFGIVAFVILIAVITNPNEDRHKSAVKSKILSLTLTLQKPVDEMGDVNSPLAQAGMGLGSMIGGAIVEQLVNTCVSEDNYVLFSLTKITWNGETRIIGVGVFGNVFLTDKIDETLKKGFGGNTEEEEMKMKEREQEKMDSLFNDAAKSVKEEEEIK
ncbi:MAG: hypothetical protein JWP12_3613 [Bacteroidetes bacterium]|nr:hypothetical protein [Bacteroidota bacterium]